MWTQQIVGGCAFSSCFYLTSHGVITVQSMPGTCACQTDLKFNHYSDQGWKTCLMPICVQLLVTNVFLYHTWIFTLWLYSLGMLSHAWQVFSVIQSWKLLCNVQWCFSVVMLVSFEWCCCATFTSHKLGDDVPIIHCDWRFNSKFHPNGYLSIHVRFQIHSVFLASKRVDHIHKILFWKTRTRLICFNTHARLTCNYHSPGYKGSIVVRLGRHSPSNQ